MRTEFIRRGLRLERGNRIVSWLRSGTAVAGDRRRDRGAGRSGRGNRGRGDGPVQGDQGRRDANRQEGGEEGRAALGAGVRGRQRPARPGDRRHGSSDLDQGAKARLPADQRGSRRLRRHGGFGHLNIEVDGTEIQSSNRTYRLDGTTNTEEDCTTETTVQVGRGTHQVAFIGTNPQQATGTTRPRSRSSGSSRKRRRFDRQGRQGRERQLGATAADTRER